MFKVLLYPCFTFVHFFLFFVIHIYIHSGEKAVQIVHHMQWPDTYSGQTTFDYYTLTRIPQTRRLDITKETLSHLVDYGVVNQDERYLLLVNTLLQMKLIEGHKFTKVWSKMLHGYVVEVVEIETPESCGGFINPYSFIKLP